MEETVPENLPANETSASSTDARESGRDAA
jgi:hypothetical protein